SVDHGVTPPSAQATILAATVRPGFEVAVAAGVMAITDVHGGAGARAAEFFTACQARARGEDLARAIRLEIEARLGAGQRIEGLGHRVHTRDPRRDALWTLAAELGLSGPCVEASRLVGGVFKDVKGLDLPVNVDGVIGALVADMGLDPRVGKALFVFGRVAGLAAHYYEEIMTQPRMRRVNFAEARYRGA
ncbi:MAG: citryl-CoA lyase, partial [Deltaproteobacteria bacterium]|nr:citryl-CoA lyase [Deltaproteobacteria bacterium]